jgi:hypothetical protein
MEIGTQITAEEKTRVFLSIYKIRSNRDDDKVLASDRSGLAGKFFAHLTGPGKCPICRRK